MTESTRTIQTGKRIAFPPLLAYVLLALIYISTFRVLATLPLEFLHQAISTAAIAGLSLYYLSSLYLKVRQMSVTRLDVLIWVFVIINFFAAVQAKTVFGQPYYFGIMAQRSVLLALSGPLLITLLRQGWITLQQVERSFFWISVVLLVVFYYFFLFVNPVRFGDAEFVAYSPIRGYRYRFQFALVIMLLFYSLIKFSKERQPHYAVLIGTIFFYLVYFLQSRTTLAVLVITLMIYFYRNFTFREKVKKSFQYGFLLLVALTTFFSLGLTSLFEKYQLLYNNVVSVFVGETPDEASSAVRFMELNVAMDHIRKHPWFGNGFVSSQWNGGWHEILGYFYPVDIGILGNVFVFGLIGTLVIYLPFVFSWSLSRQIHSQNVFYKTCEYMLLFFFLSMFFSAVNIRDSSSILFLVCLLYYFRYHRQDADLLTS